LDSVHSNITYVLADQTASDALKSRLTGLKTDLVLSNGTREIERSIFSLKPDLIIVDQSFLQNFAREFEKISRLNIGIRFIPVIYIGSESDGLFDSLGYFRSVISFSPDDTDSLIRKAEELLAPTVRVRFWGVRGSTPCANFENIEYGGNTSCVEIDAPGMDELLILDSGTGIRNLGNHLEMQNGNGCKGRIFITHPHWDHIQGFPFFKPFYSSNNSFSIHLPEQYRGGAQEILSGHLTKTFFPVTLDMLAAELDYVTQSEEVQQFGHYSIEYLVANHPTKTAIYKVTVNGIVIVYAPDNELPLKTSPIRFLDNFEAFVSGCDLLIHGGHFSLKQYDKRVGWGHSAWERVVEVAKRNKVKNLYLVHHDPDANDDVLEQRDEVLKKYRGTVFQNICLAKEGSEIRLPIVQENQ
jgi:phosphoribosyl 1,2-cyclic phosphodiesterase